MAQQVSCNPSYAQVAHMVGRAVVRNRIGAAMTRRKSSFSRLRERSCK